MSAHVGFCASGPERCGACWWEVHGDHDFAARHEHGALASATCYDCDSRYDRRALRSLTPLIGGAPPRVFDGEIDLGEGDTVTGDGSGIALPLIRVPFAGGERNG